VIPEQRQANNAFNISLAVSVMLVLASITLIFQNDTRSLLLAAPALVVSVVAARLARRGRHIPGSWLIIAVLSATGIFSQVLQRGQGAYIGIIILSLIGSIAFNTLPRRFAGLAMVIGVLSAILIFSLDQFGSVGRPVSPTPLAVSVAFSIGTFAILSFFVLREFATLDLRTKIVLGILSTGGLALVLLSFFALNRAGQITNALSERLETSVSLLAEEQLVNLANQESDLANQFFEELKEEVERLAEYRVALQSQRADLNQGGFWNAETKLIELEGGQYGNSARDVSSVLVPVITDLNPAVIAELNTSAYLDLAAPQVLENNPAIFAIYSVNSQGVVRYYPNIELATLVGPDFDARTRPYYEITAPLFNPQKRTRWTIPYLDAAGGGLVVTVAAPVYYGDVFSGIIAADIQLAVITERISTIQIGQTGFAFMLDDAGRIISMPPAGYDLFGISPEDLPADEYFKQTILGKGSEQLRSITTRMVAGGRDLAIVQADGVDTYISYAPVAANGYSLALVVPAAELQGAIIEARAETQAQTRSAIQTAVILLAALFLASVVISIALGQIIAAPVRRLTEVASRIAGGDLSAQVTATTRDVIGTLADAFNTMTARLRETLGGLEQKVEERTAELSAASQSLERRAKQFEAIAQVARTISSTRDLDVLLTQITTTIHREFGFYHVGIFLVDQAREYAVLSAANSAGGQVMLARGHRLKIGEAGIVGFVTATGRPRVALDVGADAVFFDNPDLPDTRSEIALPLRVGDEIIGALDVQSTEANAFTQEDINILSTLADQVGIAIQNARQFEQTRHALAEAEALSKQFIRTGWSQFTRTRKLEGIRHTGARSTLLYKKPGRDGRDSSPVTGQLKPKGRGAVLSLPVKLRGEVIGTVDVRSPENRQWDQDELDIVNAILERSAIAMENARLLAESQKLAAKERTIGEIAARISAQSEIDDLLKTAAQELSRTLPGMEISVQLAKDEIE
jgi:GAF domain-containing protein/HAMP domain-containing protein/PAS domain-containing protein